MIEQSRTDFRRRPSQAIEKEVQKGLSICPRTRYYTPRPRGRGQTARNPKGRVGAWRSLVARCNGVAKVAGSNPVAPTRNSKRNRHLRIMPGGGFSLWLPWVPYGFHAGATTNPRLG